jgi:hypothetical protein
VDLPGQEGRAGGTPRTCMIVGAMWMFLTTGATTRLAKRHEADGVPGKADSQEVGSEPAPTNAVSDLVPGTLHVEPRRCEVSAPLTAVSRRFSIEVEVLDQAITSPATRDQDRGGTAQPSPVVATHLTRLLASAMVAVGLERAGPASARGSRCQGARRDDCDGNADRLVAPSALKGRANLADDTARSRWGDSRRVAECFWKLPRRNEPEHREPGGSR